MSAAFDFEARFAKGLPAPAPKWSGFPKYNFIGGHNDPESIPVEGLIEAAASVLRRRGQTIATYGQDSGPLGDREMRQFLSDKMNKYRGMSTTIDDILVTSGSGQGLDLINEILCEAGDTVIMEEFTYQGAMNRLRARGVTVLGAKLDDGGLDIDALEAQLDELAGRGVVPKFVYTIPTVQNPTSSVLSLERRHRLLAVTRARGIPVIEDECYADLLWDETWPASMLGLDGSDHVIHVGSFSKYLAPALRLGYVVAPWSVLSRMIACKGGGTGALEQMVVAEYMRAHYDAHVAALNVRLKAKRDALIEALEESFGTYAEFGVPPGGIYLWIKLPAEVDTLKLADAALKAGIAFNPGPQWSVDPAAARNHLRICFANPSIAEIREGVAKLAEVCFEETGIPPQSANVSRGG
jgi:2-aminoadipate transaminase